MLNLQLRLCIGKFKTSFTRVFFVLNSKVSKQEILIGLNSRLTKSINGGNWHDFELLKKYNA